MHHGHELGKVQEITIYSTGQKARPICFTACRR